MNTPLLRDAARLHDADAESFRPGRLWSLRDMLKENAADFMQLGVTARDVLWLFDWDKYAPIDDGSGVRRLVPQAVDAIQKQLRKLAEIADRLNLPVSASVLRRHFPEAERCPQTKNEMEKIIEIFEEELSIRRCLFIPTHLESWFENDSIVSDSVRSAFPNASSEIRNSGTALAAGLFTAAVFHAMRASEIGLRSMHSAFPMALKGGKSLELAEWREVLDALSNVARDIENRPNSNTAKEPDLHFVCEAAAQFRFFKNGWRVRVAHARATYDESQAREALEHVRSFFEVLATRLTEI
jgi:hypothetical protein